MTTTTFAGGRAAGILLSAVIVELTAATAYIHYTLGGPLFLLNAAGFAVLALAYAFAAVVNLPFVQRWGWLARFGLTGYTLATIAGYLIIGPYFALGWVAKGIEIAIVGLVGVDLLRIHGSPSAVLRAISDSTALARVRGGFQRG